ncbi:MAG: hypothetical protein U0517_02410 [Candidatus Andersenbacteria bacterium]
MKRAGIILIIVGVFATLWGAYALMMAFNGYTMDTSYLGRGTGLGYSVSATTDANGKLVPITPEQEAAAAAEYDVGYQANIRQHKLRGSLMLGAGVVALAVGIGLTAASKRKSKK